MSKTLSVPASTTDVKSLIRNTFFPTRDLEQDDNPAYLRVTVTEELFREAFPLSLPNRYRMTLFLMGGVFLLVGLGIILLGSTLHLNPAYSIPFVLSGLWIFVWAYRLPVSKAKSTWKKLSMKNHGKALTRTIYFYHDHLELISDGKDPLKIEYDQITRTAEGEHTLLLFHGKQVIILEKPAVS